MKALTFELSGKTAFYKKPDVNSFAYFTYGHIHRIALMGLLGAVIGLSGYNQQSMVGDEDSTYPEFYEKLRGIKTAILPMPRESKGYFSKKLQVFNNSVGYASKEEGGNLIVREQWLENPAWRIYILDDASVDRALFDKLSDYLLNNRCVYPPYLGKNDHPACIEECRMVELQRLERETSIQSLFLLKKAKSGDFTPDESARYMFREMAPVALNSRMNFYECEEMCLTNLEIENIRDMEGIYVHDGSVLSFF
jgi:CRISPR-associated protein Cas5h